MYDETFFVLTGIINLTRDVLTPLHLSEIIHSMLDRLLPFFPLFAPFLFIRVFSLVSSDRAGNFSPAVVACLPIFLSSPTPCRFTVKSKAYRECLAHALRVVMSTDTEIEDAEILPFLSRDHDGDAFFSVCLSSIPLAKGSGELTRAGKRTHQSRFLGGVMCRRRTLWACVPSSSSMC